MLYIELWYSTAQQRTVRYNVRTIAKFTFFFGGSSSYVLRIIAYCSQSAGLLLPLHHRPHLQYIETTGITLNSLHNTLTEETKHSVRYKSNYTKVYLSLKRCSRRVQFLCFILHILHRLHPIHKVHKKSNKTRNREQQTVKPSSLI